LKKQENESRQEGDRRAKNLLFTGIYAKIVEV